MAIKNDDLFGRTAVEAQAATNVIAGRIGEDKRPVIQEKVREAISALNAANIKPNTELIYKEAMSRIAASAPTPEQDTSISTQGNRYSAMDYLAGPPPTKDPVAVNQERLSSGGGQAPGPELGVRKYLDENKPGVGDDIMDAAGALLWHAADSMSIGLLGLIETKLNDRYGGTSSFMAGLLRGAEDMRTTTTEAGKYAGVAGEILGFVAPAVLSGGATAGIKGGQILGKAGKALSKTPVHAAFGAGKKLVGSAATKGARKAVGKEIAGGIERSAVEGVEGSVKYLQGLKKDTLNIAKGHKLAGRGVEYEEAMRKAGDIDKMILSHEGTIKGLKSGELSVKKIAGSIKRSARKNVDDVVKWSYEERKSMSPRVLRTIGEKTVVDDAANIYSQKIAKTLRRSMTEAEFDEFGGAMVGAMTKQFRAAFEAKGAVRSLGELAYDASPFGKHIAGLVGTTAERFAEEAVGFAVHNTLKRATESISEIEVFDEESVPKVIRDSIIGKEGHDPAILGDVRTAFIFSTGGGMYLPGLGTSWGLFPMKMLLAGRDTGGVAKAMSRLLGGEASSYESASKMFGPIVADRMKRLPRLGRLQALLKRGGVSPTKMAHAAELDYVRIAEQDPMAFALIMRNIERLNKSLKETKNLPGTVSTNLDEVLGLRSGIASYARAADVARVSARASGVPFKLPEMTPTERSHFKLAAEKLQGIAEAVIARDKTILEKAIINDFWRNSFTAASIAWSGGDMNSMWESVQDGTTHPSDLMAHMVFSVMSATHPIYSFGMGNFKPRRSGLYDSESFAKDMDVLPEAAREAQSVAALRTVLGMPENRLFLRFTEPAVNELRASERMTSDDRNTAVELVKAASDLESSEAHVDVYGSLNEYEKIVKKNGGHDWRKAVSIEEVEAVFKVAQELDANGIKFDGSLEGISDFFKRGEDFDKSLMDLHLNKDVATTASEAMQLFARLTVVYKNHMLEKGVISDGTERVTESHFNRLLDSYGKKSAYKITNLYIDKLKSLSHIIGNSKSGNATFGKIVIDDSLATTPEQRREMAIIRSKYDGLFETAYNTGMIRQGEAVVIRTMDDFDAIKNAVIETENQILGIFPEFSGNPEKVSLDSPTLYGLVHDSMAAGMNNVYTTLFEEKLAIPIEAESGVESHSYVSFNDVIDKAYSIGILRQEGKDSNRGHYLQVDESSLDGLTSSEKTKVVNFFRLISAQADKSGFSFLPSREKLTVAKARALLGQGDDASTFKLGSGDTIQVTGGIAGMLGKMSVYLGDGRAVAKAVSHSLSGKAAGLSKDAFAVYRILDEWGLIANTIHGRVLAVPMTGHATGLPFSETIKRYLDDKGLLADADVEANSKLLDMIDVYAEEWEKAGLITRSYLKDEYGEVVYAAFEGEDGGESAINELLNTLSAIHFREVANSVDAFSDTMKMLDKVQTDPEYRKLVGSVGSKRLKNLRNLTNRVVSLMYDNPSPSSWREIKRIFSGLGLITDTRGKIVWNDLSDPKVVTKLAGNVEDISDLMMAESTIDRIANNVLRVYQAPSNISDSVKDVVSSGDHAPYSAGQFMSELGIATDRDLQRKVIDLISNSIKAGSSPDAAFKSALDSGEFSGSVREAYKQIAREKPNALYGVAKSLLGRSPIRILRIGDWYGEGADGKDVASTFRGTFDDIPSGFLVGKDSLMEEYGYEVVLIDSTVDGQGNKINLLGSGPTASMTVLSRIDNMLGTGTANVVMDKNGKYGGSNEAKHIVFTYFGDIASFVGHVMPEYGEHMAFVNSASKKISEVGNGVMSDTALGAHLKKLSKLVSKMGEAKNANGLAQFYSSNKSELRTLFYLLQFEKMLGASGVREFYAKEYLNDDGYKTTSRYRQANSRAAVRSNDRLLDMAIDATGGRADADRAMYTVHRRNAEGKPESYRAMRAIIVDDDFMIEKFGGSNVTMTDGYTYTQRFLVRAMAHEAGFDPNVGVMKNSVVNLAGDGRLITKQAGGYNTRIENWMRNNGIAMVITKSAAKIMTGSYNKIASFGEKNFLDAMIDGDPIVNVDEAVIEVPVETLRLTKVPHDADASLGYQTENMMGPEMSSSLMSMYEHSFNAAEELFKLIGIAANGDHSARRELNLIIRDELRKASVNGDARSADDYSTFSPLLAYSEAPFASPLDFRFGRGTMGVINGRVINDKLFKGSTKSGRQMVLSPDVVRVLNSSEAVAGYSARFAEVHKNSVFMGIGLRTPTGSEDFSAATEDVAGMFGSGSRDGYNGGNRLPKSSVIYRPLIKKMSNTSGGASTEGFTYRAMLEAVKSDRPAALESEVVSMMRKLDSGMQRRVAMAVNNMIVDSINGQMIEPSSFISELRNSGLGMEAAEIAYKAADTVFNEIIATSNGGTLKAGSIHDGFSKIFGEYSYDSRRAGATDGLSAMPWGIAGLNQRFPSTRPNDTIPAMFVGFLPEEYGNQYILNYADAVIRGEADYDIDSFNYWFSMTNEMLGGFVSVRNSVQPVKAARPHKLSMEGNNKPFDPLNHEHNMRYAKDQNISQAMRGRVISSAKAVDKMIDSGTYFTITRGGTRYRISSKFGSSRDLVDTQPEIIENIIARMVQEVIDTKGGLLSRNKLVGDDRPLVHTGLDPFAEITKATYMKVPIDKDGNVTGAEVPLGTEDLTALREVAASYRSLLGANKGVWEGDVMRSMTYEEKIQVLTEYYYDMLDGYGYRANAQDNMTNRARSRLIAAGVDESVANSLTVNMNTSSGLSMMELAAVKILELTKPYNRHSTFNWTSEEDAAAIKYYKKMMGSTSEDYEIADITSVIDNIGLAKGSLYENRKRIMWQLRNATVRMRNGDKTASTDVEILKARLMATERLGKVVNDRIRDGSMTVKDMSAAEYRDAIQNTRGVEALLLAAADIKRPQDYNSMVEAGRQIRGLRKFYYRMLMLKTAKGADVDMYDGRVQLELERMVSEYFDAFGINANSTPDDTAAAMLALMIPDAKGKIKNGSSSDIVFDNIPTEFIGISAKILGGYNMLLLERMARGFALASAAGNGDFSSLRQVSDMLAKSSAESVASSYTKDKESVNFRRGVAERRLQALKVLDEFGYVDDIEIIKSGKGKIGPFEYGTLIRAFANDPTRELEGVTVRATKQIGSVNNLLKRNREAYTKFLNEDGLMPEDFDSRILIEISPHNEYGILATELRDAAIEDVRNKMSEAGERFDPTLAAVEQKIRDEMRNRLRRMVNAISAYGESDVSPMQPNRVDDTGSPVEWLEKARRNEGC